MTPPPDPLHKTVDRVAIARYGAATNDFTPIHFDDEVARRAGLPGVIAHGLLSFGYVGQFLTDWCGGDPDPVRRIRLRFLAPIRPGDEVVVEAVDVVEAEDSYELSLVVRRGGEEVARGDAGVRRDEETGHASR